MFKRLLALISAAVILSSVSAYAEQKVARPAGLDPTFGYPISYVNDYFLSDSPNYEKYKESYAVLEKASDDWRHVENAPAAELFPAIELLRNELVEHCKPTSKEIIWFRTGSSRGDQMVRSFIVNNLENADWLKTLPLETQRNIVVAIGGGGTFVKKYATLEDLKNDELLYSAIGVNLLYRPNAEALIERAKVDVNYVSELQDKIFSAARAKHCTWPAFKSYFLNIITRVPDAEAVKILKEEINSYLPVLNPSNQDQIVWLNKLRYMLKVKQEIK